MSTLAEHDRIAVMAYVDGELPPEDVALFEPRLALEPALADAVARERALRARLQSAFTPVDDPVPHGLLALLAPEHAGDGVPPLRVAANQPQPAGANDAHRAALPHARRWRWPEWGAIAASLVLGIVFGARLLAPHAGAGGADTLALAVAADGAITAQGTLRDALEQHVGGTVLDPNAKVGVGLTFRNHANQYCRTFALDSASAGIACRQPEGWVVAQLEHGRNARAGEAGGYRTAASSLSPSMLAAIDAMRDGDTLDTAAEESAKARGWKP
jgi:anti-sigma factor RsiW